MTWAELRAAIGIVRREYQLACRGAAFWVIVAAGALLAFWRASGSGAGAALAAYQIWQVTVLGAAVLAILLGAAAAARDGRDAASEIVLAKPLGSTPHLVVARFLGAWLAFITIIAIMLLAAALRQTVAGAPLHLGAYLNALLRTLAPIAFATALGFSLTSLLANPLAAGVAAVYWVSVPLARLFIPFAADTTTSQHMTVPLLLAPGLVALAAALYARTLRGTGRAALGWIAALLLVAGLTSAFAFAFGGEDALVARDPVLTAIAGQRVLVDERAPGFWLPDARGDLVGLADFEGRPILLAFWAPTKPDSAQVLAMLQQASRTFRSANLAAIAVCIDRDAATIGPFAQEVSPDVVVLWDRGQHYGDGEQWSDSPLALAYEIKDLPTLFLIDQHRTVAARLETHSLPKLDSALSDLVNPQ